jgi:hypothetical protein
MELLKKCSRNMGRKEVLLRVPFGHLLDIDDEGFSDTIHITNLSKSAQK